MKYIVPAAIVSITAVLIIVFVASNGPQSRTAATSVENRVAPPQWQGDGPGSGGGQPVPAEPALPSMNTATPSASGTSDDDAEDPATAAPQHALPNDQPEATKVLRGFCADFATPGEDWHGRVSAWTTPELGSRLETTDPQNVPSATCDDVTIVSSGPGIVVGRSVYSTGRNMDIRCEELIDGWKVTVYTPVTDTEDA